MKSWSVLIVLMLYIISCSNRNEYKDELLSYSISPVTKAKWNLHNVIDSCFYVNLETTDSTLLGNILKIEVDDSIIAILDDLSNSLQMFSIEGTPVGVIMKPGMGPGEYVQLSDFTISVKDKNVRILDAMQGKVIDYSLQGDLLSEKKLPFNTGVSCIARLDDNIYVFDQKLRRNADEWKYDVLFLSESSDKIEKMRPYTNFCDITLASRESFNRVNDTLTYFPTYNDTLFSVVGTKLIPRYRLDFGGYWYDYDYLYDVKKNPKDFIVGLKNVDFVYFLNVLETTSHIWVDYCYKEVFYHTIIKKCNNSISTYLRDDAECRFFNGLPLTTWNDFFVIPVKPDYMVETYGVEVLEDNNPYLLFVKFK